MTTLGTKARRCDVGLRGRQPVFWDACPGCGIERWVTSMGVVCRSCHGKRAAKDLQSWRLNGEHRADCQCSTCHPVEQTGKRNPMWNGGTSYQGGYRAVKIYPGDPMFEMADSRGYVMEHRYAIAQAIGRPLKRGETVHHINGVKDDNRLENLELWFTNHSHGVRVKDVLADYAKLYGYHCPGCTCGGKHD